MPKPATDPLNDTPPPLSTITAVAPVRATLRDILFTRETHAAITTFSGFNGNFGFVDKFHWFLRAFAVGM